MSDMRLPEGKTCKDCFAYDFCKGLFQCKPDNRECDYYPVRFKAKIKEQPK